MHRRIFSRIPLTRRALQAGLQVMLLMLLVPLGIVGGWHALSPSPAALARQAAGGADSAALLELVERAPRQQLAADTLLQLLIQDAGALNALARLATGNEAVLRHLIHVARVQPDSIGKLADVPMNYAFALALLQHMKPQGTEQLRRMADTRANACFLLGVACENGLHMPQDWAQAACWYGKARVQNPALADFYYARAAYQAGLACHQNDQQASQAAHWFREAALCNHAAAQCALGVCYATGEGVEMNLQEAVAWYHRAAEQNFVDALFNLGWCYLQGEGVTADAGQSAAWFRKAADCGDDLAQYYLGRACELGHGVPVDMAQALYWYRRAATEQQNDAAQCALGHCYAQGLGVPQNWQQAVYWYLQAAEQGRTEALLALSRCFEYGLGVARNAETARYWRERAADESPSTIPES